MRSPIKVSGLLDVVQNQKSGKEYRAIAHQIDEQAHGPVSVATGDIENILKVGKNVFSVI